MMKVQTTLMVRKQATWPDSKDGNALYKQRFNKRQEIMKILGLFTSMICLSVALTATAHDFTATVDGQKIYFNITSKTHRTAEVTYQGSISDRHSPESKGYLEIPSNVRHGKIVYQVTQIGPKAFSGATGLTGVMLPSTVKEIGDFAFEGCTNLSKVIFPGGDVKMGQGTFFKCTALQDLSFGSDWKMLDLASYRWSDSLRSITIPAKVEKIKNFKSLASLSEINVDANNSRFSTYRGILYNKDFTTLYGVPRAYKGILKIKEGTITVTRGALIDCLNVTCIDISASVQTFSFRETSRMPELKEIVLRGEKPMTTAYSQGEGCFLLQIVNSSVKINVPKKAKKEYARQLVSTPGEYTESEDAGSIPYKVDSATLPQTKNIHGLKNFNDYD